MTKKVFVVTWTNHVVGQVDSDSIKCFEDYETARSFAKLMSSDYEIYEIKDKKINRYPY